MHVAFELPQPTAGPVFVRIPPQRHRRSLGRVEKKNWDRVPFHGMSLRRDEMRQRVFVSFAGHGSFGGDLPNARREFIVPLADDTIRPSEREKTPKSVS